MHALLLLIKKKLHSRSHTCLGSMHSFLQFKPFVKYQLFSKQGRYMTSKWSLDPLFSAKQKIFTLWFYKPMSGVRLYQNYSQTHSAHVLAHDQISLQSECTHHKIDCVELVIKYKESSEWIMLWSCIFTFNIAVGQYHYEIWTNANTWGEVVFWNLDLKWALLTDLDGCEEECKEEILLVIIRGSALSKMRYSKTNLILVLRNHNNWFGEHACILRDASFPSCLLHVLFSIKVFLFIVSLLQFM